jgi:hypothetical protein
MGDNVIERPSASTRQAPGDTLADLSSRAPRSTDEATASWAWPLLAAAVCVALVGYGTVFDGDVRRLGWDPFAYMWQARAVDLAAADATARPGVPTLAAWLGTLLGLEADDAVAILVILLPLLVGLGAGLAVRLGLRAPVLALPIVILVTAVWPAIGRSMIGYYAFLLSMALLVAASALLVHARGRALSLVLLVAGFLAHPLFFATFAAIVGGWAVLTTFMTHGSAAARLRASLGVPATVTLAGLVGALALFVLGGVAVGDLANIEVEQFFRRRTVGAINQLEPSLTVPLVAIGATAALITSRSKEASATRRLWAAWLVVTLGATAAALAGVPVPGGRFIFFAAPLAMLAGLGIATVATVIARRPGVIRITIACVVTAGLVAALMPFGLRPIDRRQRWGDPAIREVPRSVASYLEQVPGSRPVVVVAERPGLWGAFTPKFRLNSLRSAVPDRFVLHTHVYVGGLESLLAGRPTLRTAADGPSYPIYNRVSRRMWEDLEPVLDRDPVVLVLDHTLAATSSDSPRPIPRVSWHAGSTSFAGHGCARRPRPRTRRCSRFPSLPERPGRCSFSGCSAGDGPRRSSADSAPGTSTWLRSRRWWAPPWCWCSATRWRSWACPAIPSSDGWSWLSSPGAASWHGSSPVEARGPLGGRAATESSECHGCLDRTIDRPPAGGHPRRRRVPSCACA